jgi:APA family basic amino acid/polyamine antiporter
MASGPTLARRLTFVDAVVIGLGAMIGAGVFSAIGPAARSAGSWLLLGLLIAGAVAFCNATSSAQLAAVYPESGGTYVYGRERLGPFWGYLAGWGFVVGKTASCAAMALTFGAYLDEDLARPLAVGAVVALTVLNSRGVTKTALATRLVLAFVLAGLAVAVLAFLFGGTTDTAHLTDTGIGADPYGILQSAGLLFFAFAGYARIATLGEEVVDPARTIPRAIPIALGVTLVVYAVVATAALLAVGPALLAASPAPLADAVRATDLEGLTPIVEVAAVAATLGVLLSLIVGVSRTTFAMARDGELPRWLDAVHPRFGVPHHAELAVGAVVVAVVLVADLRGAIGFSSFAVLTYYAIANASAFTLPPEQRRWPRALTVAGLVGCATLAVTLPWASAVGGAAVLALGAVVWSIRHRNPASRPAEGPR